MKRFALSAMAAALLCATAAAPAIAAAPMVKTSAPGFYRMMLGDFEVTAISDGTNPLPVDTLLQGMSKADITANLKKNFEASPLETSFNAFLINTGSKLVLVDTGAAGLFGPNLGKFAANLMAGDKLAFPNATVRAQKQEADYWLSEANMKKDASKADFFKGAMASLNPYVKAGKFKPFEGDVELVPGVSSHSGKGHTPGHATYVVESRGQKLVLIGDLIHVAAVQMAHPDVTIGFDSEPKEALASRRQAFDAAARAGYLIGGAHLAFPGIGHLRKEGKGYDFVPVNYEVH